MKLFKLFLTSIIISISIQSIAQQGDFTFGLKAGPNFGWLRPSTNEYKNDGTQLSFTWGFISDYYFADNYAISTGFNVNSFRGKLQYPFIATNVNTPAEGILTRKYRLQYIELPMLVKFKTNDMNGLSYFGQIGFGASFNVRANGDDTFSANDGTHSYSDDKIDIKEDINLFRASLIVGVGTEYTLEGNTSFIGGVNFNNGFFNILKGKNNSTNEDHSATNNMLEIYVGVLF